MSISGVVYAVWTMSWGDDVEPCLAVEITPDEPTSWAKHPCFRTPRTNPWPLTPGDRVSVPVHHADGHVTVANGPQLRMLGGLFDRDQPLR